MTIKYREQDDGNLKKGISLEKCVASGTSEIAIFTDGFGRE